MSKPIDLEALVGEMQFQSDEMHGYFDRESGTIFCVPDDAVVAAEDGTLGEADAWEDEAVEEAQAIAEDDGTRFVALPDPFNIHEWQMMKRFATGLADDDARSQLLDALHGRGAFRMFKNVAERLDLLEQWHRFRDAAYRQVAIDWCEEHGISYEPAAKG